VLGLIFRDQTVGGFALAPRLTPAGSQRGLADLFDLFLRGNLEVTIGGTYPLERAGDAHRALEGRKTAGKLVLLP
jgi:NADPH2:quinone reductase